MTQDELMHYGVLGMKWGKRKARYSSKSSKTMSADAKEVSKIKKKKVSEMSNEELRKANNRLQLEQNYSRLNPNTVKKGMMFVGATVATMNTALNLYNNSDKLIKAGRRVVNKFKR